MQTILIAEQDSYLCDKMMNFFTLEGFNVLAASEDNMNRLFSDIFPLMVIANDKVITDSIARRSKNDQSVSHQNQTALVLTGNWSDDEFQSLQYALSADFILNKPFDEEDLIEILEFINNRKANNTQKYLPIIDAEEQERKRLSLELHDGVCSMLAGGLLLLERAMEQHANNDPNSFQRIEEVYGIIDHSLLELRRVMNNLSPIALKDNNLVEAITKICDDASKIGDTKFVFTHQLYESNVSPLIANTFYRVIQEITNNILKYAHASQVNITLTGFEDELILDIRDDGVGFDVKKLDNSPTENGGRGLSNISQRIHMLNGLFHIHSVPQVGTSINISVPLN